MMRKDRVLLRFVGNQNKAQMNLIIPQILTLLPTAVLLQVIKVMK